LRFLQFELWTDCPFACEFCFNKNIKNQKRKLEALSQASEILEKEILKGVEIVGVMGGELFNPCYPDEVKEGLVSFFNQITSHVLEGNIGQVYVNTPLLHGDRSFLEGIVRIFEERGILDKLLICTSWDPKGRFEKTPYRFKFWERDMLWLREIGVKVHVEVVLTQSFLNSGFDFKLFSDKYSNSIGFITPHVPFFFDGNKQQFQTQCGEFFPKRKDFMEWLVRVRDEGHYKVEDMLDRDLHSNHLYFWRDEHGFLERSNRTTDEKYHPIEFRKDQVGYIDSDRDMREDVISICSL